VPHETSSTLERPFRGARQRLRSKLGGLWPLHMALRRWAPRLPCLVEGCLRRTAGWRWPKQRSVCEVTHDFSPPSIPVAITQPSVPVLGSYPTHAAKVRPLLLRGRPYSGRSRQNAPSLQLFRITSETHPFSSVTVRERSGATPHTAGSDGVQL